MAYNNRQKFKPLGRIENIREERKALATKDLLTFSFKDLDQTQPHKQPQSIATWRQEDLLKPLFERLRELSKLNRDEALKQEQIKIYGDFPSSAVTDFEHPNHVDGNVAWGVIKTVGGQKGTVAGYIVESTFYVVFLDKDHRFWISTKKHT